MNKIEMERLERLTDILEKYPKSAVTEGWRRNANLFDDLDFIYTSVSSGKDSVFMSQMAMLELLRRNWISELLDSDPKKAKELMDRYSKIRKAGLASQREDTVENIKKWDGMRIGIMQMDYEITFNESKEVMLRMYKEYATDIKKILPEGKIDPEKSVKENGYDLRWISDNEKENPYNLSREKIEAMKPKELEDIYGKALVFGWGLYFPISWVNAGDVDDSRYISFDPDKKKIWVNEPPIAQDPHHEWCVTLENMYDNWHGMRPMFECLPGSSDQKLRVDFSAYISKAVPEWLEKFKQERGY